MRVDRDDGPIRFARYAAPPHDLGYCGPSSATRLDELVAVDAGVELRRSAREFAGAYPYLELLAGVSERHDPLSADVVEAYWLGNALLTRVPASDLGRSLDDRFRRRAGSRWGHVESAVPGGCANHAFHVLVVSPWVGLMREGVVDEPLAIVDHCRVSWGTVIASERDQLVVRRSPLQWVSGRLRWGPERIERVTSSFPVEIGSVVSIHWRRACEILTPIQLRWLVVATTSQLEVAASCGRPC